MRKIACIKRAFTALIFLVFASHVYAQNVDTEQEEVFELIIRLNSTHYSPEKFSEEIESESNSIEEKIGRATSARYLITTRKKIGNANEVIGAPLDELLKGPYVEPDLSLIHPESIEAKLQSYIVLSYPSREDLDLGKSALSRWSDVVSVHENARGDFQATPNDHFFLDLDRYQWGFYQLNLPAAWDITTGHGYIGVPDSGLDITHPDLKNYRPHFSANLREVTTTSISSTSGHGSHVTGIIAATTDNDDGVAGVCWNCSIAFQRIATTSAILSDSYSNLVDIGVQVINSSWQLGGGAWSGQMCDNPIPLAIDFCDAVALVTEREILISASAGNGANQGLGVHPTQGAPTFANGRSNYIQFPASDPRTIAVGAVNYFGNRAPFSDYGAELDIVAPGTRIQSTIGVWVPPVNGNTAGACTDEVGPGPNDDNYGNCTGTSMSAPHITGILGLMRSTDPLLNNQHTKDALFSSGSFPITKDPELGHGMPDVEYALELVLGTVDGNTIVNRLTPLFSLYSSEGKDSLYTTVPQAAYSAIKGTLPPQPPGQTVTYLPAYGVSVPHYREFPQGEFGPFPTPVAEVYVFTTSHNPITPSEPLVPLYRLSYQGTQVGNPKNIDHVYTTEQAGIDYYSLFYKVDGIEGYIFDDDYEQPDGTEKLYRYYNASRDDHAIFPESKLNQMISAGYLPPPLPANEYIGFVYPNVDRDNDELIDGFELAIHTCINDSDTDNDGDHDGEEVLEYPRTDPKDAIIACGDSVRPQHPLRDNAIGTLFTNLPFNYALGYHFTPLVDGVIDRLGGRFNSPSRVIKLFKTSTGQLLGQVSVSSTDNWNYNSITPVAVQSGVQYTVAVYMNGGNAGWRVVGQDLFPKVYDYIRIDGTTFADTSSNANAIPTNLVLHSTLGEPDIRFTPSSIPPGC